MKKRDVLNSPRLLELKKERQKATQKKALFIFSGTLFLLIALVFISRSSKLNLADINVVGNKVIDAEIIQDIAKNATSGHYLWFFPKSNLLFYPEQKIKTELTERYPRLKEIAFNIRPGNILEIDVSERESKYMWCGENIEISDGDEKCYFMDDSGYIFDDAPYFSGEVYFKFFGPLPHTGDTITGNNFLLGGTFEKTIFLKDNLSDMGLKPVSLLYKDNGEMEFYLSSATPPPLAPKVVVKKDSDFSKIAENLEAALDTEPLKADVKKKYSSLQYIDLRFGNKVYYKFKNGIGNE